MPIDFDSRLSTRARTMVASSVREICKLVQRQDIISLAGGWPNPETFPADETARIVERLMRERPGEVLQYGMSEGLTPLREWLAGWLGAREGVATAVDGVLMVSGAQMGMDLACRVLVDDGDVGLVELPTYFGGTGSLQSFGARIVGVPVDDGGMDVGALERILLGLRGEGRSVKLAYVQPTFHNPLGVTLSGDRRRRLLDLASEHDFFIAEDSPYGDLCYSQDPVPPLKALDTEGRVIYIRSFSKIFAPGIRLAVVVAHPEIASRMVVQRQFVDCCPSVLAQWILFEFCRSGDLDRRIAANVAFYSRMRETIVEAVRSHIPPAVRWTEPHGGFFLFMTLPHGMDASDILEEALAAKVAFVPGTQFFVDGSGRNTLRLSFAQTAAPDIVEAVKRLGTILTKRL